VPATSGLTEQRTSLGRPARSEKGPNSDSCTAAKIGLLDDLVGTGEDRRRDIESKRLRSPEIDHQLKFARKLNGQIGRLGTIKNFDDIGGRMTKVLSVIDTITNQAASIDVATEAVNDGQAFRRGEFCHPLPLLEKHGVRRDPLK
jgi:hypothetical protein